MHPNALMPCLILAGTALFAAPTASAQDILYYKFDDSGCPGDVINHAVGPQAVAASGRFLTGGTPPAGYNSLTAGRFGGGLRASRNQTTSFFNRVDTGWSLTLAFWARQTPDLGTGLSYLIAGTGGHRMFTNGAANSGLLLRDVVDGGQDGVDVVLPAGTTAADDFQMAAAAGWAHVALVIDASIPIATWYLNGLPVATRTVTTQTMISEVGEYRVGMHLGTGSASGFDLDEFLLSNRAYGQSEILVLANAELAGSGNYDSGSTNLCGNVQYTDNGTAPSVGNVNFGVQLDAPGAGLYVLVFGFSRCSFSGFSLPLDGGFFLQRFAGCDLLVDLSLGTIIGGYAAGTVNVGFPIPPDPNLSGLRIYSQAAVIDSTMGNSAGISRGLGLAIH